MKHTYTITGMTCGNCEAKVRSSLLAVNGITAVSVSNIENTATITMTAPVLLSVLQQALGGSDSKYHITENSDFQSAEVVQSWFKTYKPILIIFTYIVLIVFMIQVYNVRFDWMQAMRHFMAGFFLIFSFFKMLDLKGFTASYKMYDVIAIRFPAWGYLYAFFELALGIAYLVNFNPIITNVVTVAVMSISSIGVIQSVMNKRKIQCACLGAVFNLPMSTLTIIEDAIMIVMSLIMLAIIL